MQDPVACPNPACEAHARNRSEAPSRERFFRYAGTFTCQGERVVRRFQCRPCGRNFSEQTLSPEYRQKRPDINAEAARLAQAGLGSRALARALGVNRKTARRRLLALRGATLAACKIDTISAAGPGPPGALPRRRGPAR